MKALEDDLEVLTDGVARLGGLSERALRTAMQALVERDADMARSVIAGDRKVDVAELRIDAHAETIIALRQPVARDLRQVLSAIKIAPSLERIGDHATNVAERVLDLSRMAPDERFFEVVRMGEVALRMLRASLDAYVSGDAAAARQVIASDDELDRLLAETFNAAEPAMVADPERLDRFMRVLMIAKNLERIGDQVTNICEMMIYAWEGTNLRHAHEDPGSPG